MNKVVKNLVNNLKLYTKIGKTVVGVTNINSVIELLPTFPEIMDATEKKELLFMISVEDKIFEGIKRDLKSNQLIIPIYLLDPTSEPIALISTKEGFNKKEELVKKQNEKKQEEEEKNDYRKTLHETVKGILQLYPDFSLKTQDVIEGGVNCDYWFKIKPKKDILPKEQLQILISFYLGREVEMYTSNMTPDGNWNYYDINFVKKEENGDNTENSNIN